MIAKNNFVKFYAYIYISFLFVAAFFITDHHMYLSYGSLVFLFISLYLNRRKYYSIINMLIILLLMCLFTMMLEWYGVPASMVNLIGVRNLIINDTSLEISIYVTSVAMLTLSAFSFLFDDDTYIYQRLPRNIEVIRRRNKYFIWGVIVLFSYLSNMTTTLFEESYGDQTHQLFIIGGWNTLFVVAFSYYLVLTKLRRAEDLVFTVAIIIFWLMHGNRGEIFPVVLWILVYRFSIVKKVKASKVFIVLFVIALGVAFNTVGTVRGMSGDRIQAFYDNFLGTGSTQIENSRSYSSTAGASAYALTAVVDGVATGKYPLRYGMTYVDYVYRTVPMIIIPYRPETIEEMLYRDARTLGGSNYLGEPFLNFYVFGPYIYSIFIGGLLLFLQRRSRSSVKTRDPRMPFRMAVYAVSISMLVPRIAWYGFIYLYKALLLFLAIELFFFITRKGKSFRKQTAAT